ncbi:posphoenolpyruvate synthetase regulatory kinase/phosphorylase PpsR [Parachitinimonas caeni]|uniref:Putative phosphoenolpyruvate synthase regulatory protein n=1 Tax=Parachitinimonas caeni TaxID=3031301 RepID=A0ABT7DYL2_9NEIS|nr:pyruvate, water dikinase regulatory protein [Parachitinimonas caeni]MDK2125160.1 kinase/pyrophosphorylase [Parachitinimonas caeni]
MPHRRTAFFISDRTGITAEMLGHSLLTQFEGIEFKRVTLPFIDSPEKAAQVAERIRQTAEQDQIRPLVFSTIVNEAIRHLIHIDCALTLDFFEVFISPLEAELAMESSHTVGRSHGIQNFQEYNQRIEAVNYAMSHDDGMKPDLAEADIILVGVSRSGKTPTCLYLALQYGIKAANYPLTPEDFGKPTLPKLLHPYKHKLFGLTISPERLQQIRSERKPDSRYAALDTCRFEIQEAEALMRNAGVTYLNTTSKSIEELASTILHKANLARRIY